MHYKSIALNLLEEHPQLYDRLRQSRTALSSLDRFATALRSSHSAWKHRLAEVRWTSEPQISSEALEHAVEDLRGRLRSESLASPETDDHFDPDGAMEFLRQATPSA